MQKGVRINESQLLYLSNKARQENTICGYLQKKGSDSGKWQLRWFALYQNLLFYYENDTTAKLSGVALLEGCYCERLITPSGKSKECDKTYCFAIYYRKEGHRQYDLRADTESECTAWIDAIQQASFSKVLEQKEQLEQKHLHLLQILDSERQAKWHYVQQTEELAAEVKKLKDELRVFKNERRISNEKLEDENEEIRKIKKVQSFFRGWLCRRRWKQIVDEYIRSDHAESMRKRNSIMFGMVECEEEYVKQLSGLVTVFLRPLRMTASSKKPPITHEDVNSIFLNSETLLFLHQIFLKGLMARMENWPTLVLGDLFDMLLPMLGIYQEYVRNHHYSLQVLAEYKQKPEFNNLLRRYEEKSVCEGRSLETFLTYPMHQIPRYIITIHELLAHTPHDHVERKSLEFAQSKLEELSQSMQDEVSETENIRKNLAIERMIVEGCDILLDVNQTFVRQGSLIQVMGDMKPKSGRSRLGSFSTSFKDNKKDVVRQTFLFTNHILLTTRASNGRLHLAKHYGKIPLIDCTLVEDPSSENFYFDDEASSYDSSLSLASHTNSSSNLLNASSACEKDSRLDYNGVDFRLIVNAKSGPPVTITLVASTLQEKAAWCSDISQCIENLHYSDLLNSSMSETSSVTMPQSVNNQSDCTSCSNSCSGHGIAAGSFGTGTVTTASNGSANDVGLSLDHVSSNAVCTCDHHLGTRESTDGGKLRLPKIRTPNHNSILPAMIARSDPKLFRDDVDIKFSRTLNSCKVPQIRHASVDRLLDRLTDLRFLSIDFLNTFLLTYRVFTTGETVLDALTRVYRNPEYGNLDSSLSLTGGTQEIMYRHSFDTSAMMSSLSEQNQQSGSRTGHVEFSNTPPQHAKHLIKPQAEKPRRISTGCMKIEVTGEKTQIDGKTHSSFQKYERQDSSGHSSSSSNEELQMTSLLIPPKPKLAPIASCETLSETSEFLDDGSDSGSESLCSEDDSTGTGSITVTTGRSISETSSPTKITLNTFPCGESSTDDSLSLTMYAENNTLTVPGSLALGGCSSETLISSPSSCHTLSTATSSDTLVPVSPRSSPLSVPSSSPKHTSISSLRLVLRGKKITAPPIKIPSSNQLDALALSPATSPKFRKMPSPFRRATSPCSAAELGRAPSPILPQRSTPSPVLSTFSPKQKQAPSPISYSFSSPNIITNLKLRAGKRGSAESDVTTLSSHSPRSSFATVTEGSPPVAKVGTVVTSSRASKRRMSSSAATAAFAAATAGSANPKDQPKSLSKLHAPGASNLKVNNLNKKRESVISTAATMRVLSVLRHWVAKHSQDFEENHELKARVKDLLEEMVCNTNLLPAEHKAAASILRVLTKEEESKTVDLGVLLQPPSQPTKDTFDTLSALDIAEQLTYLDHQIFMSIRSEELLSQAWMKPDKAERAPHVLLVSKRFNEVSRLVVSEIIGRQNLQDRVSCIEKWAAIADICRCMHNYNGVLQICAAFVNSSVYRLKKTWEKISKQTKAMIEKLQTLVSSDGRFKNMRDALHRCDPPCIPYLGMYLTDLSFIEEGTPNVTEERLVNFSKMRMVAHVIREIQLFQQTPYRIEHHKRVTNYLLDTSRLLDDDETYRASLEIEPRQPRVSMSGQSTA